METQEDCINCPFWAECEIQRKEDVSKCKEWENEELV